jgi:CheY-like chemotaxis protein
LYHCLGIVEMHSGFIAAQSEGEGHGTEFYFDLPLARQAKYTKSGRFRTAEDLEDIIEEGGEGWSQREEDEEEEDAGAAQIDEVMKKQRRSNKSGKISSKGPLNKSETDPVTEDNESHLTSTTWWTTILRLLGIGKGTRIYTEEIKPAAKVMAPRPKNTVKGAMNNFLNYPVQMLGRKFKAPSPESVDAAEEDLQNGLELPNSVTYVLQRTGDSQLDLNDDIENQNSQSEFYNPSIPAAGSISVMNDNISYQLSSPQNDLTAESSASLTGTNVIALKVVRASYVYDETPPDMSSENTESEIAVVSTTADLKTSVINKSLDVEEMSTHTSTNSSGSKQRPKPDWNAGISILLVDDADSNRKMCRKFLSTQKHDVTEAKDGLDCLRVYDEAVKGLPKGQEPFDLILMDDNMPNLLGYETAKKLRETGFKGIIIGVTGDIYPENIERFTSNGANDVLGKPLNVPKLKERFIQLVS